MAAEKLKIMTLNFIFAIILMLAVIADIVTTERGLKAGASEANPVARELMSRFGRLWYVPKLITAGVVLYAPEGAPWWAIAAVAALLLVVVVLNLRTIRAQT